MDVAIWMLVLSTRVSPSRRLIALCPLLRCLKRNEKRVLETFINLLGAAAQSSGTGAVATVAECERGGVADFAVRDSSAAGASTVDGAAS